jgi:Fe-S-cluster-containing hydrogenase component 2
MEMDNFSGEHSPPGGKPGKIWVVSHKLVAQAAGLGKIGIHRNLIHPKFGNFIVLGTVLLDAPIADEEQAQPLDYNPCLECKLCVAACPVGAISPQGDLNFSACYTHNYREFMGGFTEWVERVADSKDAKEYRSNVTDSESASMWQSLSFGANYKAAYCLSVCPAGEDVIGPYLAAPQTHLKEVVRPLQQKKENLYVIPGSDAEQHAAKRFPHKKLRHVASSLRPATIAGFLGGLPLVFQPKQSAGLNAVYHFTFTGKETAEATVHIANGKLEVQTGHIGQADLHVEADSQTWLAFLRKERHIAVALLLRKIKPRGDIKLLQAFGRCFPS